MKLDPNLLLGPARDVFYAAWETTQLVDRGALLLEGNPGTGKTDVCDRLARQLAMSDHAVEHVNGQSVGVELVRAWRTSGAYGNLFSPCTIKRIDELDFASSSAVAELLTLLDYLPKGMWILATTNDYGKLAAAHRGRLESRFVRFRVDAPTVKQTMLILHRRLGIPRDVATELARGAVPEGCLETEGCNVRTALKDALGYRGAVAAKQREDAA